VRDGSYGRHWQPFSPQGLCTVLPGGKQKRILFLGDSLTEQMASALAFNLLRDEAKPVDRAAFENERPRDCLEFLRSKGVKDGISCFTFRARACPALQVTFLLNNRLRIVTDSVTKKQTNYYLPFSSVSQLPPPLPLWPCFSARCWGTPRHFTLPMPCGRGKG